MRFALSTEQQEFAAALSDLLRRGDAVSAARSWADGDSAPGRRLWSRLCDQGVAALLVEEDAGGLGGTPVDLVTAMEVLGHELAVGPWVESAAFLATALRGEDRESLAGGSMATVADPTWTPYALDAGMAERVYAVADDTLLAATAGRQRRSLDTTRLLGDVTPTEPVEAGDLGRARDLAVLAASAQLLGCGERLLADTVEYVKQRRQYGRTIGSYQALKHRLADVRIALDFARPLVHGAALDPTSRDVSAAKVAAGDAAYAAARTALQLHGGIGYTAELDLGLWILRVRALYGAWGGPAVHRARVHDALLAGRGAGEGA